MKYLLLLVIGFGITKQETFIDSRDQESYTLISIKSDRWVKENIRFKMGSDDLSNESSGGYYKRSDINTVCPEGFHVPTIKDWKKLIETISGKENTRQGKLIPIAELKSYDLVLGGMGRKDTVLLQEVMGYYWTSSDTLKTYFKDPDGGLKKHLLGIHIWSSGEKDSINIEPTYMLASTYESWVGLNCKCIKD